MSLPAPNLDDLRFQADLVDEARKRIAQYCPEWTDYNVSDPGITLIELFSWLTEMMVYRLNRVPEKNYVKFLELLGMQRLPASSARTDLTFWLSTALPLDPENMQAVLVPQGQEVRSGPIEGEEELVFSTDRPLHILPPSLAFVLRGKEVGRNYLPRLGLETFYPFDMLHPRPGDTFYLGFDPQKDLSGHILQLRFTCEPTEAVGIRREDPPWVWECSLGNGQWQELPLSTLHGERDTTGGLNNPSGSLTLYLPLDFRSDQVNGREAAWVRCRIEQRHPAQGMYTESPRVTGIGAFSLGATVPASHAQVVRMEELKKSTGDPGQEFSLQHAPVLDLQEGETLLVEEYHGGEYTLTPWQAVSSFSDSRIYDRHFCLNAAEGKVLLGPAVRQPDGSIQQYGRLPEHGRRVVFKQYRYGGGARGNLPPNTLQTLTSAVPYVARVTNLARASGGQDQETLDEVKLRARRELQAQKRAVTAQDFEQAALGYSRYAARVRCITPGMNSREVGVVRLLVVPAVADSLQVNDLSRLHLSQEYVRGLTRHLDQYRLLTTHVRVYEPGYLGLKVKARIVAEDFASPEQVAARVDRHLRNFINPLPPYPALEEKDQLLEKGWAGWPFGRSLFVAEVYALVQRVPGVKYVLEVEIFTRPVDPRLDGQAPLAALEDKLLRVPPETLLCSLEHEILPVEPSEIDWEGDHPEGDRQGGAP